MKKVGLFFMYQLLCCTFFCGAQTNPDFYYLASLNGSNMFTFNSRTPTISQFLYYPSDFNQTPQAGFIHTLYIRSISNTSNAVHTELLIKLKLTSATALPTGPWSNFVISDTVLYADRYNFPNITAHEWVKIPLDQPFWHDGISNIALEISGTSYLNGFTTGIFNSGVPNQAIRMKYGTPLGVNTTNPFPPIFAGFDMCADSTGFLGNDTALCTGNQIVLQALANAQQYLWNDGSTQPSLEVNTGGTYFVTLKANLCYYTDTIEITEQPSVTVGSMHATPLSGTNFRFEIRQADFADEFLWDFGDGQTATGQTVTHQYAAFHNYTIRCTVKNACSQEIITRTLQQATSISNDNAALLGAKIYPNPCKNVLHITVSQSNNYEVEILDLLGKQILKTQNTPSIDVSKLPVGSYFLEITATDLQRSTTLKFLKL